MWVQMNSSEEEGKKLLIIEKKKEVRARRRWLSGDGVGTGRFLFVVA